MEHTNIDRNIALTTAIFCKMPKVALKILIYPEKYKLDKNKIDKYAKYAKKHDMPEIITKMEEHYSKKWG